MRNALQLVARHELPVTNNFFFTTDREALNKYYEVREYCYRRVKNGPREFDGQADSFDSLSDTLVITHKNKTIGGARITSSSAECRTLLPAEQEDFNLIKNFPELDLHQKKYCEVSRLAVLPEYRSLDLLEKVMLILTLRAARQRNQYLFTVAPLLQSRCYRRVYVQLKSEAPYIIHADKELPQKDRAEYGSLKMLISSIQLLGREGFYAPYMKKQSNKVLV
jgi:hypothetical protein